LTSTRVPAQQPRHQRHGGDEDDYAYANRYVPVLTIVDRQVTRWRDYLDPVAVFDALGWPET
jgi:ketosteroid isomerase-like protein